MTTQDPHNHDIHRFEDDGAPHTTPRIGIPGDQVVLKDAREPKPRFRDQRQAAPPEPPKLIIVGKAAQPAGEPPQILDSQGEPIPSLTWQSYCAWRKTKCRPFCREDLLNEKAEHVQEYCKNRLLEEIDQAVLEFIGEVAEMAELFTNHGPLAFFADNRKRLIDEAGDIFFCGVWVLDAWGLNPLTDPKETVPTDLELIRVSDDDVVAQLAQVLGRHGPQVLQRSDVLSALAQQTYSLIVFAQTHAGLLANSFKKLRYHHRDQNPSEQVSRVFGSLIAVNQILMIANSSVEEALKTNMRKLDARYPNGYRPGQGGGKRTGEGA